MKRITMYAHVGKWSAWEAGEKAGLGGEALRAFRYAGSEHAMTYDVNEETGEAKLVEVDGRAVA